MSHEYVSAVFDDAYFTPARKPEFLVALALAEWTNVETGICWPSVESIAKRARISVRGAQEALRQLSASGKLRVGMGEHASGTSVYRLVTPARAAPPSPQGVHHPPQTSGASLHPEPEGTVPSLCPDVAEFVGFFATKIADLGPPLPLRDYLAARRSDFATVGWKKGNRPIANWRELESSLAVQYRNDHAERKTRNATGNQRATAATSRATDTLNHATAYPKEGVIGGRKPRIP